MNWIEIDKIICDLFDKYYVADSKKFYDAVAKRFSWTAKQTKDNTDYIVKLKTRS